jgi:hypothetical protein
MMKQCQVRFFDERSPRIRKPDRCVIAVEKL